ncbi:MAG: hypothetical protein ACFFG0_06005 [Candidatus Thorarchaeota archaeon]
MNGDTKNYLMNRTFVILTILLICFSIYFSIENHLLHKKLESMNEWKKDLYRDILDQLNKNTENVDLLNERLSNIQDERIVAFLESIGYKDEEQLPKCDYGLKENLEINPSKADVFSDRLRFYLDTYQLVILDSDKNLICQDTKELKQVDCKEFFCKSDEPKEEPKEEEKISVQPDGIIVWN